MRISALILSDLTLSIIGKSSMEKLIMRCRKRKIQERNYLNRGIIHSEIIIR